METQKGLEEFMKETGDAKVVFQTNALYQGAFMENDKAFLLLNEFKENTKQQRKREEVIKFGFDLFNQYSSFGRRDCRQICEQVNCIDTGSQICNLMFSQNSNELVSTHGYSLNKIIVWSYPQMQKITTLTGHTQRVLYLSGSPCGQNIVTGAGDETLRFWNIFPSKIDVGFGSTNSIEIR